MLFIIVTVHPPLPLKLAVTTVPDIAANILVPGVAGISIPLCNDDAKAVGDDLLPKYELIFVIPRKRPNKVTIRNVRKRWGEYYIIVSIINKP